MLLFNSLLNNINKKIMKHSLYILKSILLAVLLSSVLSCSDDFLEVTPRGSVIANETNDYFNLLENFQPNAILTSSSGPNYLADDIVGISPFFEAALAESSQKMFKWEDEVYRGDEDGNELNQLRHLYTFNKIINEVMDSEGGTEEEKKSILAEAKGNRAWTLFYMVNFYGKPFNAATSSTDLGIPIIKIHDIAETNFTRATVKEVYDFIIEDLQAAIPDLPNFYHRNHMNKAAGYFLLGKVYVYMASFEEALTAFNECSNYIAGTAEQPLELWNLNSESFPLFPLLPDVKSSFFTRQIIVSEVFGNELAVNPEVIALFDETTDERFKQLFSLGMAFSGGAPLVEGLNLYRKSSPFLATFEGQLADYYLFSAECKARLGDLSGAIADVEFLRKHRMPDVNASVPTDVASDQTELLKFILEERRREFVMVGVRWFDMRRLSVDPLFSSKTYTHTLYNTDGSFTTIDLRPERLTLRFPQKIIDQNPGMINND